MIVSARTPTRLHKPFINAAMTHNTDFNSRNYSNYTISKTETNENIAKISKRILKEIVKIKPSRFNHEMEVGSYITHLKPGIIYDHAMKMLECEDPQVRDWAIYLLFKSAEKGNVEALTKLGMLVLSKAPELNKDQECKLSIGIKLLEESAKHGDIEALKGLGFHHLKGNGVNQDIQKALDYYMQAHDIGNSNGKNDAFRHVLFIRHEILRSQDPKKAALTLTLNDPRE